MTIFYPDVSHRQSGLTIQPGTVAVCAKSSEGTTFHDPAYAGFREQAAGVGAVFFAYHYLHRGDAAAQADYCHGIVGDVPVMIDCEATDDVPTVSDCLAFAAELRAAGGRCPLVYLPQWYWRDKLGSPSLAPLAQAGLNLVSSDYTNYSDTGPGWNPYGGMTPAVWQYTDSQSYGGYSVDFDAYRGTIDQFRTLLTGTLEDEDDLMPAFSTHALPEGFAFHADGTIDLTKVVELAVPPANGGALPWGAAWLSLATDLGTGPVTVRLATKADGHAWGVETVTLKATDDRHVTALPTNIGKITIARVEATTGDPSADAPVGILLEYGHR
jgi:hypothetical protein